LSFDPGDARVAGSLLRERSEAVDGGRVGLFPRFIISTIASRTYAVMDLLGSRLDDAESAAREVIACLLGLLFVHGGEGVLEIRPVTNLKVVPKCSG
jgi:hypothetical protein